MTTMLAAGDIELTETCDDRIDRLKDELNEARAAHEDNLYGWWNGEGHLPLHVTEQAVEVAEAALEQTSKA